MASQKGILRKAAVRRLSSQSNPSHFWSASRRPAFAPPAIVVTLVRTESDEASAFSIRAPRREVDQRLNEYGDSHRERASLTAGPRPGPMRRWPGQPHAAARPTQRLLRANGSGSATVTTSTHCARKPEWSVSTACRTNGDTTCRTCKPINPAQPDCRDQGALGVRQAHQQLRKEMSFDYFKTRSLIGSRRRRFWRGSDYPYDV